MVDQTRIPASTWAFGGNCERKVSLVGRRDAATESLCDRGGQGSVSRILTPGISLVLYTRVEAW